VVKKAKAAAVPEAKMAQKMEQLFERIDSLESEMDYLEECQQDMRAALEDEIADVRALLSDLAKRVEILEGRGVSYHMHTLDGVFGEKYTNGPVTN